MSKKNSLIAEGLRRLTAKDYEVRSGYVKSIDEANGFVYVITYDNEEELNEVLLRGTDEAGIDGALLVPAVGSDVIIASVDGPGEWVVIKASKLERLVVTIGETKAEISEEGIVINGGDNAGIVKLHELQDNLTALKKYCSSLDAAIKTGLAAVGVGGSASGPNGKTAHDTAMTGASISFKDMENQKVKH